jgi:DNA-binding transcriptional LysR family regulator
VVASVLVELAHKLRDVAPGIRLDYILPDDVVRAQLDRGDIDLLISPAEFMLPSQPSEELYTESHVIVGWSENPLFLGEPPSEEAIFAAGHVAVSLGSDRTTTFGDRQARLIRGDRRVDVVVSSFTMVPWMLVGTDRLAFMHRRLAAMMSRHLPIAFAPLPFAFPTMRQFVQYHRSRANDPGLRWLVDEIKKTAALTASRS